MIFFDSVFTEGTRSGNPRSCQAFWDGMAVLYLHHTAFWVMGMWSIVSHFSLLESEQCTLSWTAGDPDRASCWARLAMFSLSGSPASRLAPFTSSAGSSRPICSVIRHFLCIHYQVGDGMSLRRQHYVSMLMFSFFGMLLLHTSSNCYSYKSWDKSSCAYTNRLQVTELSALCLHITTKHKEHQKSICCFKSLYKVEINASDYTTLSYEYMDSGRDSIGISNPVFHAAGWIGYSEERKSFCPPGHLWDEGFNTVKPGFLLKCSSLSRASVHCTTPKQRSPKLLPKEAFFSNIS